MYRFWIYIQQLPMSGNLVWSFWTCHFTERLLTHAILSWLKAVFTSPETTANSKCICRETVWKSNILFGTMLENHSDWTGYSDSEENGIGVSFKCFFQAIVYTVYSKLKISFYYFWSTASIWVYVCVCVCVTAVKYNINRNNTHSAFSPLILGLKLKYTIKIVNTSPLFKFMPYIWVSYEIRISYVHFPNMFS